MVNKCAYKQRLSLLHVRGMPRWQMTRSPSVPGVVPVVACVNGLVGEFVDGGALFVWMIHCGCC